MEKHKNNRNNHPKKPLSPQVQAAVDAFIDKGSLRTDPQGSYTGTPRSPLETPVQDADDL